MKVLFATQSDSLVVFEAVRAEMSSLGRCDKAGFLVSDRWSYAQYLQRNPGFENGDMPILKEWELTAQRTNPPDTQWLAEAEKRLGGDVGLFGALVADRRIWMGPNCTFAQDYRRRFTDDELNSILAACVTGVEKLFDELQPDALVGFICVTVLDYVAYLVARARGIAILNLRPARVSDRVFYSTRLNDPAPEFLKRLTETGKLAPFEDAARAHIARVRESHGRYEGVVRASDKPALKVNRARRSPFAALRRVFTNQIGYRRSGGHEDNHVVNPGKMVLHSALINPLRARIARHQLAADYIGADELKPLRYAFFPIHTEPEVSLLVYGRPYVNQIEVIRSLAMSLPADFTLLVKEHPWMVGKRSMRYYRAVLNIPRVKLVRPSVDARDLIINSRLVATITGSTALEAAILGKPVLTFGDCPYNALPETMVRRANDPRALTRIVRELLSEYACDDDALAAYLATTMSLSEGIQLYSTLLGKQGVHTERASAFDDEAHKLADYTIRFYNEIAAPVAASNEKGVW